MSQTPQLQTLYKMIDAAETNIRTAKALIREIGGTPLQKSLDKNFKEQISKLNTPDLSSTATGRVVEGVFNGENMIGKDKKTYPVPANYASKSKLVEGDMLKLAINDDGAFIYKQIGPVKRKRVIGRLTYDDGRYIIISEEKTYQVLLASVTYFKAKAGQMVTILIPEEQDSKWGAIENVVENPDVENAVKDAEEEEKTFDLEKEG